MRSRGTRHAAAMIAVTALVIAACTGNVPAASSGPPSTPSPSAVPVGSPTTAATSTAQPSASSVASALPESGQPVFPGTYTTHFQPPLTLTVGREVELSCVPGYQCRGDVDVNVPGWLFFEFGNAPAFEIAINRIDKVFDPKHAGKLIDPPRDLAAWVASLPGLTLVEPPKRIRIGGVDATQLDVRSSDAEVLVGPIPGVVDPAGAGIGPHFQSRIDVIQVAGHDVLIFVDAQKDSVAQFEDATAALQPLVDSIVWH